MAPTPTLGVDEDMGDLSGLPPSEAVSAICAAIIVGQPRVLSGKSSCSFLYHGQRFTFDESHEPAVMQEWLEEAYPSNVVSLADYKSGR